MRKLVVALAWALIVAMGLSSPSKPAWAEPTSPNIVFILVDDMRADDLAFMPQTRKLLELGGVNFTNAFAVNPLCCPSRATLLAGQYAHNTGVMDNDAPDGGFSAFKDAETIGTWLDRAGYRTGYVGKYLNEYGSTGGQLNGTGKYIPPGWDTWRAAILDHETYYGPTLYNINGEITSRRRYETDLYTRWARRFIRTSPTRPFFLHLSYTAPHSGKDVGWGPPTPARRHRSSYNGMELPKGPAYNERFVGDKPTSVRIRKRMSPRRQEQVRINNEQRRESLLSVDEGVAAIYQQLREQGVAKKTYVVFTSDNGYALGEHRRAMGKTQHYEPISRIPLVMRGPALPAGAKRQQIVGLHDLAPTFLQWAGTSADFPFDGIDLTPLIEDPNATGHRTLLIEGKDEDKPWREYDAIRMHRWKYVEYVTGEVEMYNLARDPHETRNLARKDAFERRRARLAARLHAVRNCAGAGCR